MEKSNKRKEEELDTLEKFERTLNLLRRLDSIDEATFERLEHLLDTVQKFDSKISSSALEKLKLPTETELGTKPSREKSEFKKMLDVLSNYPHETIEDITYYYDSNHKILGYRDEDLIVLYFHTDRSTSFYNHFNLIKIGIVRDFGYTDMQIISIAGYSKTFTGFELYDKNLIDQSRFGIDLNKVGTIGSYLNNGHFEAYDKSFEIIFSKKMCSIRGEMDFSLKFAPLGNNSPSVYLKFASEDLTPTESNLEEPKKLTDSTDTYSGDLLLDYDFLL